MFKDLRRISGILSDLGIMGRSEDPEQKEKAMFEAAGELWELVKQGIPSILRADAALFWEQLPLLDVCDDVALMRLNASIANLIKSGRQYIPSDYQQWIIPHLMTVHQLIDRAKLLAKVNDKINLFFGRDADTWECPKCQMTNTVANQECSKCGEDLAPDSVVRLQAAVFDSIRHDIQGGSL